MLIKNVEFDNLSRQYEKYYTLLTHYLFLSAYSGAFISRKTFRIRYYG